VAGAWISEKLNSKHKLNSEEIQAWKERIQKRANEGRVKLMALQMTDEQYKFWELYWGCAACNGATEAVMGWED
jgi:peroxiredoxin family protein